jgi:hypothetical protein
VSALKSIEDYTLLSAYYHLLFTIEEGLCYLIEAEQNLSKTEGDRIYQDLIQAFGFHPFNSSFRDEHAVRRSMR